MQSAATALDYCLIDPPHDLSGVVRFYWRVTSLPNEGSHYIFRTMANGYPVLFFLYSGDVQDASGDDGHGQLFGAGICGPTTRTGRFRLRSNFGIFGACLYPFAVQQLFGVASTEISDRVVNLADLMGVEGSDLVDRVLCCPDDRSRVESISGFLRSKLAGSASNHKEVYHAFAGLIRSRGDLRIEDLANEHHLSRRTFERRFVQFAGLSPKSYSNVVRFQASFEDLTARKYSLTEVAYRRGYYDQSHFTHDFTRFSGFNPKDFTTKEPATDPLWLDFVAFFQFLSWCPPVLCFRK
jgi:AraC-like DNA-binding protein